MGDHVFICYARKDEGFVLKLAANLKGRSVPVWLDQWDIPLGANWNKTIDKALSDCAYLLVVLSPESVDSVEVQSEWLKALAEKKTIVPIIYRSCLIPRQLFLFQHADFTSRSPDDETALNDIMSALGIKAGTGPEIAESLPLEEKYASQPKSKINRKDADTWMGKGNVLSDQGKYDQALQAYEKSIELDPKYAYPWNGKGNVLSDQGKYDQALQAYEKSIELDPKFAYPWNGKGAVFKDQKRYYDAIKCYDKAIELDPQFELAKNNRELALKKL